MRNLVNEEIELSKIEKEIEEIFNISIEFIKNNVKYIHSKYI